MAHQRITPYLLQALLQEQQHRQAAFLNNAIEFNEALIEERDEGIQEIARQIGEVIVAEFYEKRQQLLCVLNIMVWLSPYPSILCCTCTSLCLMI
jgi:hypothetical protein